MKNLNLFVEHAIAGEKRLANAALRKAIYEKSVLIINEDHEKVMTKKEMVKYLKGLWKKADSNDKKAMFLSKLGKLAGVKNCSESDLQKCAEALCFKGKKQCDDAIHVLEKIVGVVFKKEAMKEGYEKKESSKDEYDEDEYDEDDEDDEDEYDEDDEDEDDEYDEDEDDEYDEDDEDEYDEDDEYDEKSNNKIKKSDYGNT